MSRAQLSKTRQFISVNTGGRGSNVDPFAKDLFATNGFQLPVTNANASVKWVEDKDGVLVKSPAGYPAMPGMRLATTVAEGALLGPELWTGTYIESSTPPASDVTDDGTTLRLISNGTFVGISVNSLLVVGKKYQFSVNVSAYTGPDVLTLTQSGGDYLPSGTGTRTLTFDATATMLSIKRMNGNGCDISLLKSSISVREVIPTWYLTDTDGTPLFTISRMIRTPQGSVQEFDETYPGVMVEPAATNKCTCRKINPTNTTNLTASGGTLSLATNQSAKIATAKLSNLCTTGSLYKLINTSGSDQTVTFTGACGNTNKHSIRLFVEITGAAGSIAIAGVGSVAVPDQSGLVEYKSEDLTPSASGDQLVLTVANGGTAYFIMPELVESPFLGSPVMPKPTEDGLSTVTRLADPVSFPTPSWLLAHQNDFAVIGTVIPKQVATTSQYFINIYKDANNSFSIYQNPGAAVIRLLKKVGGVNVVIKSSTLTSSIDKLFRYIVYQSSTVGSGLTVRIHDGTTWGNWDSWSVDTTGAGLQNIVPGTSVYVGSVLGISGYFYATFPMTRILRIPTNLSAAALQAWLVAKAGA